MNKNEEEKGLLSEAFNPNNDWKWWERVAGVAFGLTFGLAHKVDNFLKETGIESENDSYEMEPWDYR